MGQSALACGGVVGGGGVMPGRRQVAQCRGRINVGMFGEREKEGGRGQFVFACSWRERTKIFATRVTMRLRESW